MCSINRLGIERVKTTIKLKQNLRILGIQKVSPDFLSRHAKSRTYFYRLALLENGKKLFKDYQNVKKVEQVLYPHLNKFDSPSSFFALANFTTAFERNLLTEIRLFNKFITILKK